MGGLEIHAVLFAMSLKTSFSLAAEKTETGYLSLTNVPT